MRKGCSELSTTQRSFSRSWARPLGGFGLNYRTSIIGRANDAAGVARR